MTFHYNLTGEDRKKLVYTMAELLECAPRYLGMPTCSYEVGNYTVSKTGDVAFNDMTGSDEVERLVEALLERGYEPEVGTTESDEAEEKVIQNAGTEEHNADDRLTIIVPNEGFTEAALNNLRKLVASRETLIRKALGCEDHLEVKVEADRILFPWFKKPGSLDINQAYAYFVNALCDMAKNAKRITAKDKPTDNDKYAFRCFLLRLGFIGDEYKLTRKVLLEKLEGSSAFRTSAPAADTGTESEVNA